MALKDSRTWPRATVFSRVAGAVAREIVCSLAPLVATISTPRNYNTNLCVKGRMGSCVDWKWNGPAGPVAALDRKTCSNFGTEFELGCWCCQPVGCVEAELCVATRLGLLIHETTTPITVAALGTWWRMSARETVCSPSGGATWERDRRLGAR